MGKYTHLRHKLEPFSKSDEAKGLAKWYKKVDDFKQEFIGTLDGEHANATRLAAEYAKRDLMKRQLEDADIPQLNIELEALSQLGIQAMEADGVEKIHLADGGYVRIDDLPFPAIRDREKALNWFVANGYEGMLEVSFKGLMKREFFALLAYAKKAKLNAVVDINTGTLQKFVRDRRVAGFADPDGVKTFGKTKLTVRSVGNNGDEE